MSHSVQPNLDDAQNHGGSEFLNCNIPRTIRTIIISHTVKYRIYTLALSFKEYTFHASGHRVAGLDIGACPIALGK